MRQLAAKFGVHRLTVATILRTRNIPLRRQGLAEHDLVSMPIENRASHAG
jgi:hypothetical protein